jgi:hypothetical protein
MNDNTKAWKLISGRTIWLDRTVIDALEEHDSSEKSVVRVILQSGHAMMVAADLHVIAGWWSRGER